MARSSKRRDKRYTPRPVRTPILVKMANALHPIEEILDQIENSGTLTVDDRGVAVFRDHVEGGMWETAPALRGVREFFEMWATRHGKPLNLAAFDTFIDLVDKVQPISDADLCAMQVQFLLLRSIAARFDPADCYDLVQQTLVKNAMEVLKA